MYANECVLLNTEKTLFNIYKLEFILKFNHNRGQRNFEKKYFYDILQVDFYPYIQSNFTTCPKERNLTFTIFPEGLEEKVRVDVEHVCDCDCQLEPEAVD